MTLEPDPKENQVVVQERVLQRKLLALSEGLRSSPILTKILYEICAVGILAEPFLKANGLVSFNQHSHVYPYYTLILWFIILAVTACHELRSQWFLQCGEAADSLTRLFRFACSISTNDEKNYAPEADLQSIKAFGQTLAKSHFLMRVLAFSCGLLLVHALETSIVHSYRHIAVLWSLLSCIGLSLLFPLTSIASIFLAQHLRGTQKLNSEKAATFSIAKAANAFMLTKGAYLGAYLGFIVLTVSLSFSQIGLGFANWLYASLLDANIAYAGTVPAASYVYLCSAIVSIVSFLAFSPIAVRLSSSFQTLANRIFVSGDSILDALIDTANVRSKTIHLPEHNVAVRNIVAALTWLSFCYISLFFLVAYCPDPLGNTILSWLHACLLDAGLQFNPQEHTNLKLFLASIVAGYGAVPVAVMSCVFLPPRKPRSLIFSAQGILSPDSAGTLFGLSPMKSWNSLKKVELSSGRVPEEISVKLSFGLFDKLEIKLSDVDRTELSELLATADEHAPSCKFDSASVALRLRLIEEAKENSLIESQKFSSTIFSPKKSGDFMNDNAYRIVRKLAGKALSAVYLARDNVSHQRVVIKEYVLPSTTQHRERMLETFEREFKILNALHHPGIAQVIEMFEESDARYLVIEFVEGSDLRSIVERKGAREERIVIRWALAISQIMIFLHQQSPAVVHRDLTPDNLMEDGNGNIRLIDFGAAHQFMEGVTGTLIGKQCYIAPEQLRGKPNVQSDIYSFGCTLFFLTTGKDPIALRQCEVGPEYSLSNKLRALIRDCTEFEDSKRPDSFATIQERLLDISSQRTHPKLLAATPSTIKSEGEQK
ncbi:MAG: serine/threonine protein kinase [Candidatus Obscuribacterales bacterium]|jgi:tRNA A-37 threonylcarbamoyl transferase component Bud32|nr:serine/threonine protein kinase [Candidatus Obscuribacterales bacterium]